MLASVDKIPIEIIDFIPTDEDEALKNLGGHLCLHYAEQIQLDQCEEVKGISKSKFLLTELFPDRKKKPGPSVRAGDFCEILVSDYFEYHEGYVVPRIRYLSKLNRNASPHGTDVIGFKAKNPTKPSTEDELISVENKAKLTGPTNGYLQKAVDHSHKDAERLGMTLNAISQRSRWIRNLQHLTLLVQRFQNKSDRPYRLIQAASFFTNANLIDEADLSVTDFSNAPDRNPRRLLVFGGVEMMKFIHSIYRKAADEA
jgi:hypothetical protein